MRGRADVLMARIRSIHPGFFMDDDTVAISTEARLFLIGIWQIADDQGVFEWKLGEVRRQIFPDQEIDIESIQAELVARDWIRTFESGGKKYGACRNFRKFQNPSVKSYKYPLPPEFFDYVAMPDGERNEDHERSAQGQMRRVFAGYRKKPIPMPVKREVAARYGCVPGSCVEVTCAYCDQVGLVSWELKADGSPKALVKFDGLEMDHFVPESAGGTTTAENLVLACPPCNRSKGAGDYPKRLLQ